MFQAAVLKIKPNEAPASFRFADVEQMQVEGLNYRVAAYCDEGRQAPSRSNRNSATEDRALALHFDLNAFEFRRHRLDGLTFGSEGDLNASLAKSMPTQTGRLGRVETSELVITPPCEHDDISRHCPDFKQAAQVMRHLPESGL